MATASEEARNAVWPESYIARLALINSSQIQNAGGMNPPSTSKSNQRHWGVILVGARRHIASQ